MARRAIFLACFLAALAAGFAAGLAWSSWKSAEDGSFMGRELGLTEEQAERMHEIWGAAMEKRRRMHREQAETIKAERIEAVRALLDESEIAEYEAILAAEEGARDAARERSSEIFDRAVEETMEILSPEQQVKYAQFLERQRERHRRRGRGEGGPPKAALEKREDAETGDENP